MADNFNLFQKIVEVRKVAGGFSKDKQSYGYEYVSGNQILNKIKDKMNELNLLLIPSTKVGNWTTHEYVVTRGDSTVDLVDFVVDGEMQYTWINGDKPDERLEISWAYYGQQNDISKAYGSALTYSERYFLLKCLGLPTDDDDPDNMTNSNKTNASAKPKSGALSEAQIKRLYAIAGSKGVNAATARAQVKAKFKKEVENLTRTEYDQVCKGYENKKG